MRLTASNKMFYRRFRLLFTGQSMRVVKLIVGLSFCAVLTASAEASSQTVTLSVKNVSLKKVFTEIEKQTKYSFIYRDDILQNTKPISINVNNAELEKVLTLCFQDQPVTFNIVDSYIIVKPKDTKPENIQLSAFINIKGRVTNENGEPAEGVNVTVKGTQIATTTNSNGEFVISTVKDDAILVFTSINMEPFEIKVDGRAEVAVTLKTKIASLGDVQVIANTGYQKVKPNEANGSMVVIDNKTFNQQTGTSVLQRLNNVTSGLYLSIGKSAAAGGVPSTSNISIRGLGTIFGPTDPLIVLDNFIYEGDINNINPNDIENVTVLKDAAAASIWGARAGNGVIVITTKKGKFNQKIKAEFNSNVIITKKPNLFYLSQLNSSDYINVEQFLFNNGFFDDAIADTYEYPALSPAVEIFSKTRDGIITPQDSANQVNALKAIDSRNEYNKYFYRNAVTQQYAFNIKGGNTNNSWMLSADLDKNIGFHKEDYQKANLRVSNSFKPLKHLQVNVDAYYTNVNSSSPANPPDYNRITVGGKQVPYLKFADNNGNAISIDQYLRGNYTDTVGGGNLLDWKYYPLTDVNHDRYNTKLQDLVANVSATYEILNNLTASVYYQYENQWSTLHRNSDVESFYTRDLINRFTNLDPSALIRNPIPIGGILLTNDFNLRSQNLRGQLNFNKTWKDHSINGIVGSEIREVINSGDSYTLYGYNQDPLSYASTIDYYNAYPTIIDGSYLNIPGNPYPTNTTNNRFVSLYANFLYAFKERYSLYASARKDGSNSFGTTTNDKWKPLWSVGAGWEISKEHFYKLPTIPYLKFRGTFGYSGNIDVRKTPLAIINYGTSAPYTNLPFAIVNSINNPGLRWEQNRQINFSIEFATRGRVISGMIEVYQKKGTDLYGNAPYDYTTWGRLPTITKNVAAMEGKGVDINIQSKNIDKTFKWFTNLLFNYNANKTTSYYTTEQTPAFDLVTSSGNIITPVVGKPLYAIAAYKWGSLNSDGDPQGYLDGQLSTDYDGIRTGATTKGIDGGSFAYIGPTNPEYFGSLINTFQWKEFSASINISYRFKYFFRKPTLSYTSLYNFGTGTNDFVNRWQKPGDEKKTNVPAMVYTDYPQFNSRDLFYQYSDINVLKGDNIRLEYINIAYSLNRSKVLPFDQLQFFANAANLGIIWRANQDKLDPDFPSSLPLSKAYTIGVRAQF